MIAQTEGDADGKVKWRVEIELSEDPAFKDEPYRPARYDSRPPGTGRVGTPATCTCTPSTRTTAPRP